jgi:hypothetical protein
MKTIFYKLVFTMILLGGIFVGMVKGQEARQKWVSKKKIRYEQNLVPQTGGEQFIVLDEIEMATYHS